jgi:hypothetical protein
VLAEVLDYPVEYAPVEYARGSRDMRTRHFPCFIKIHSLHHAAEDEVYGLALIADRHGYELSPGSMYPLLHQLEEAGYLRRIDRDVVRGAR